MSDGRNAAIDAQYHAVTHYICIVGFRGTENVSIDPVDAWQASNDQKEKQRYWRQPQAESEDTILSCWRSDPGFSFHGYGLQQDLILANPSNEVIGSFGIPDREHDTVVPKLPSIDMQDLYSRADGLYEKLENEKLRKMIENIKVWRERCFIA
ncbi:hypothetical protein DFH05DRAFT_1553971 [Lentinula detonsa]|uniref:Uncharacterized protein n=1 Tax=Lentinula detonsa TaxID=2804962 RepID=A0A9W8PCB4_9AGAR|nr:hypothetical protein DFH05DRAFT_1553971 [Lentinula detonsa]